MNVKKLIPIGIDCSATHLLRSKGLRLEAYPFDWTVTPLSSAMELIENGFEGFMDLENLEFLPPTNRLLFEENGIDLKISKEIITPVICKRYGMLFPHDFSEKGIDDYEKVRGKYERRIQRFKSSIENSDQVRFIYNIANLNDWQKEQYEISQFAFEGLTEARFHEISMNMKNRGYQFISLLDWKKSNTSSYEKIVSLFKRAFKKASVR